MPAVKLSDTPAVFPLAQIIARDLGVRPAQVEATIALIEEGATIPFIARYRKERTGGLDDTQLRKLAERHAYLTELQLRRETVLASISEQGKLTPALERAILAAETKVELEDLYRPFKPKRRTRATIAREQGLEPLAEKLLACAGDPERLATAFVDPGKDVGTAAAALEGARDILIERMAETPSLARHARETLWNAGELNSRLVKGKEADKFRDYADFAEPLEKMPSHRALAMLRGEKEGVLKVGVGIQARKAETPRDAISRICREFGVNASGSAGARWMQETAEKAWSTKLAKSGASDSLARLKARAEAEAIEVFSSNLKDLLLAAPAGKKTVMGIDPGIRTGCKIAIVDATGKLLETATIYPHAPRNDRAGAMKTLKDLAARHNVDLVGVGNGTAGRETDALVSDVAKAAPELKLASLMVSEAGASVYSASQLAADEFPDLDVSLRGAVSIARRLQDPLAELVKIEPKAIGVGQYQHDVDQGALARSLGAVVEDCVNAVGVDVNTASAPLLTHVSGLNATLAGNIVAFRDEHGPFKTRKQLKKVPRMGAKSFEQSAGFLRIVGGTDPLDGSAVHPESYPLVERIAKATGQPVTSLIGNKAVLSQINPADFADETFGIPTIRDVIAELEKPGRDPRPDFQTASFREGVDKITDLSAGMRLEGVVTNVTAFGAFVDIGVHQDGLIHISQLSDSFVESPRDVVKAGDIVNVRVLDVDVDQKRISLSMKSTSGNETNAPARSAPKTKGRTPTGQASARESSSPFDVLKSLKR
ncbi:Tex family protein [Hyphomonas sp.]|uniref:Tex family protein n=1 Tax=Hyphomonas sp. TaxID=87 RepID=UPI0025C06EE3|nr:Tex family protein [Hyphomonas sp.]